MDKGYVVHNERTGGWIAMLPKTRDHGQYYSTVGLSTETHNAILFQKSTSAVWYLNRYDKDPCCPICGSKTFDGCNACEDYL